MLAQPMMWRAFKRALIRSADFRSSSADDTEPLAGIIGSRRKHKMFILLLPNAETQSSRVPYHTNYIKLVKAKRVICNGTRTFASPTDCLEMIYSVGLLRVVELIALGEVTNPYM